MYSKTREEEVKLIKDLLAERPVTCPRCGLARLDYFHKKAKKSCTDWICPSCREHFDVIRMMKDIHAF